MKRYKGYLQGFWKRVSLCAAGIAVSSTLLLALLGAFYSASNEQVLAGSPESRLAVAACETRSDRTARGACTRHLVARAQERDAGASHVATLTTTPRKLIR